MNKKNARLLGARKIRIAGIFFLALFTANSCIACACEGGMSNTGADCSKVFRDTIQLDFMPMIANDGTENGIDVTGATPINKALFDGMINNTDASKRLYPVANDNGLKDVEQMRATNVTRTFTDGDDEFVRQGIKNFKGWITGRYATAQYAEKLNSIRCTDMGVYKIDRGNNYIGAISADGTKLNPIRISSGSFSAIFVEATPDKNNAYIELTFNFSPSELDGRLRMIACSEFVNYKATMNRGLLDVCVAFSAITENGVTVKLETDQGTPLSPQLAKGLTTLTDWVFHNVTQNRNQVFTLVETAVKGIYTVVFTTSPPADGDIITLTITHNGFDFTCVAATPLVIPMS